MTLICWMMIPRKTLQPRRSHRHNHLLLLPQLLTRVHHLSYETPHPSRPSEDVTLQNTLMMMLQRRTRDVEVLGAGTARERFGDSGGSSGFPLAVTFWKDVLKQADLSWESRKVKKKICAADRRLQFHNLVSEIREILESCLQVSWKQSICPEISTELKQICAADWRLLFPQFVIWNFGNFLTVLTHNADLSWKFYKFFLICAVDRRVQFSQSVITPRQFRMFVVFNISFLYTFVGLTGSTNWKMSWNFRVFVVPRNIIDLWADCWQLENVADNWWSG